MPLELLVIGPSMQTRRQIHEGEPELILGRSESCDVQLPDPERHLSRVHLAIWAEAGQLRLRVLSSLKGVELPSRAIHPGGEGVLAAGEALQVGPYTLTFTAAAAQPDRPESVPQYKTEWNLTVPPDPDPVLSWPAALSAGTTAEGSATDIPHHWSLRTMQAAPTDSAAGLRADHAGGKPPPPEMDAFFRGLGLDAALVGALGPAEIEAVGQNIRVALEGIFGLLESKAGLKHDLGANEGTMVAAKRPNPLKSDWSSEQKLQYLFGGRAAAVGFISPDVALREVVSELQRHELASRAATRAALEGVLDEFEPFRVKERLLGERKRLPFIDNARMWDRYVEDYALRANNDGWLHHILDRYFMPAYARASLPARRLPVGLDD